MRFGSVCSGIEAASVAWHSLGWDAAFYSEIEKFPSRVLAHHYTHVPNLGDMTKFKEWPDAAIDLLVGGTPCQSFSVAGLRKGLADPRGNLMLTYLAIAERFAPRWLVWENVPGVLSSNGGRDFGTLLGGLAELGYGFAYRVLDAQYIRVESHARAVPQRRRRVFVVGHLGDWRRATAVLFERESMLGHPPPRRQAGQGTAPTLSVRTKGGGGLGTDFDCDGGLIPFVGKALTTKNTRIDAETETLLVAGTLTSNGKAAGSATQQDAENGLLVAHALRGEGFDASEEDTGRGTPIVPIAFDCKASGQNGFGVGEIASTLRSMGHANSDGSGGGHQAAMVGKAVRRLTPTECERLQGMPDGYTDIAGAADGPRYKALGNSMAIPPMRWIGERIAAVDAIENIGENNE
ncbi:DNA cytosine methyltransferase [Robbsia andropogonis]|uniref:DNA cytosine methyltransferase n=1 Tax=Robbsia andropogonis TaxID=28092 RepID=UPI00209EBAE0|nr:DNA cytosine methyltransferase [Robbsia andropogonis]MCP1118891.1 DNA cytosine methyltransferase [Robbsia andropogonis]MCP1128358.1 DNA cytosine methyltransferase [Robbsia andropogonis]